MAPSSRHIDGGPLERRELFGGSVQGLLCGDGLKSGFRFTISCSVLY